MLSTTVVRSIGAMGLVGIGKSPSVALRLASCRVTRGTGIEGVRRDSVIVEDGK